MHFTFMSYLYFGENFVNKIHHKIKVNFLVGYTFYRNTVLPGFVVLWEIMQRIKVIPYRRIGTFYLSHFQGSRIPTDLMYVATKA
jgi:hypothetical protein